MTSSQEENLTVLIERLKNVHEEVHIAVSAMHLGFDYREWYNFHSGIIGMIQLFQSIQRWEENKRDGR